MSNTRVDRVTQPDNGLKITREEAGLLNLHGAFLRGVGSRNNHLNVGQEIDLYYEGRFAGRGVVIQVYVTNLGGAIGLIRRVDNQ